MRKEFGVTLVELIVFILVLSVGVAGIMLAFAQALRGGPTARDLTIAMQLAQERMSLVLAQKNVIPGRFACFDDPRFDPCKDSSAVPAPCTGAGASTVTACSARANYTVTTSLSSNWNGDTAYKVVTVRVQGPERIDFTYDALAANYR